MKRVQIGGDVILSDHDLHRSGLSNHDRDAFERFVLSGDDFDAFERAGRIKLSAAARASLQATCERFLKLSILAKRKPREDEVRSLLTKLEDGLMGTSSAFHDLAASNEVSEGASIWLKRNWIGDVQTDDFVVSVELALKSVQEALSKLDLIVAGAAKRREPNPYQSSFIAEVRRIYEDTGGTKTFQAFAEAVISALPGQGHFGHSPDKRAKKQQLARAKRVAR